MHIFGGKKPAGEPGAAGLGAGTAVVMNVTAENFEAAVINQSINIPVLLDVWATWCGPCKTLGPILEKLAAAANGAFVLAKMDADENQELVMMLGIRSVPTVFLFKNGRPADGFSGALPESQVRAFLEKHVTFAKTVDAPHGPDEGVVELVASGRIADAQRALASSKNADPLLALRVALLSGNAARARAAVASMTEQLKADAASLVESAERIIELLEKPEGVELPIAGALSGMDVRTALELLLSNLDDRRKRLFLDLLALLGRGELSEEYRERFAKIVLK